LSLEELEGIEASLINYIEGLERSERRLVDIKGNPDSLLLIKRWKVTLLNIINDIHKIIYNDRGGHLFAKDMDACSLLDKAIKLMRSSDESDPIYLNLKPIITSLVAISQVICKGAVS